MTCRGTTIAIASLCSVMLAANVSPLVTKVTLACSISEEAHACHPHAAHISEETGGRASFSVVSHQLKVRKQILTVQGCGASICACASVQQLSFACLRDAFIVGCSCVVVSAGCLVQRGCAVHRKNVTKWMLGSLTATIRLVYSSLDLSMTDTPPIGVQARGTRFYVLVPTSFQSTAQADDLYEDHIMLLILWSRVESSISPT